MLGLLLVGPWPLDRRDYQGRPYSQETLRGLAAGAAGAAEPPPAPGPMRAGYGEADITPRVGEPLAGYGKREGNGCVGVHDRLRAQALALESGGRPAVVLGGDLLLVTDGLADAVAGDLARAAGLSRDRIYFSATHTHSGPGGYGTTFMERFWLGPPRPAVFARLRTGLVRAARTALASLEPATIAYSSAPQADVIGNRVQSGLPVDPDLGVLHVRSLVSRREVVVTIFGAHATVLGPENRLASGDYPGFLTRRLERRPGIKAMFLAGAVGSASCAGVTFPRDFSAAQSYGERLAGRVEAMLQGERPTRAAALRSLYRPIQLGAVQFRLGASLRLSPVAGQALVGRREGCVQALAIGDTLLVGAPADINGELAREVKAHAARRGFRTAVTSFAGRYVGYLVPKRYYDTYDDGECRLMSMFGPFNGEYMAAMMKRGVDRLAAEAAS